MIVNIRQFLCGLIFNHIHKKLYCEDSDFIECDGDVSTLCTTYRKCIICGKETTYEQIKWCELKENKCKYY